MIKTSSKLLHRGPARHLYKAILAWTVDENVLEVGAGILVDRVGLIERRIARNSDLITPLRYTVPFDIIEPRMVHDLRIIIHGP